MKKITLVLTMLFIGTVAINAQFKSPNKTVKKTTNQTIKVGSPTVKKIPNLNKAKDFVKEEQLRKNKEKLERESFKSGKNNKSANSNTGAMTLEVVSNSFIENYDVKKGSPSKSTDDGLSCTVKTMDINANTITFGHVSANKTGAPAWMKPGVVLKASEFLQGKHKMETMKRHPIIYSTNLSGQGDVTRTIQQPEESSNLVIAINDLKAKSGNKASANIDLKYREIHSLDELGFKLTGKYSNKLAGVSASLGIDYGTKKERHYYMIDYTQNMFHIDVSPKQAGEIFVDPNQPVNDLIYVSRVVYGRRGIVVVESKLDVEEFGLEVNASMKNLLGSGELKVNSNTMKKNEDFTVFALIYGGDSGSATSSLLSTVEKQRADIKAWATKNPGSPKLAEPIGYELKNMNNQSLGMRSNFKRPVETCLPALTKTVKLKVTLTDLICAEGKDEGGNGDDYGLNQYIVYKPNGKEQKHVDRDINKFSNRKDAQAVNNKTNKNQVINGNKEHQMHVRESRVRNTNINNSLVFEITPEALNDSSTKFEIYTWLKEYTGSEDELLTANNGSDGYKKINVRLKDVVNYLLNPSEFSNDFKNNCFNWNSITDKKCKPLGVQNADIWLTKSNSGGNIVDAPISLGRKDARGAVWMRFELVQ